MESRKGDSQRDEDESLWDDNEDTWFEVIDEALKTHVGSGITPLKLIRMGLTLVTARNYYYRSRGRFIEQRQLSALARLDQERLLSVLDPTQPQQSLPPQPQEYLDIPPDIVQELRSNPAHEPLTAGETARFLEILPGSGPVVECRLRAARVSDCRFQYDALSYHPQSDQGRLICNGATVNVGRNLVQFLGRLRLPDRGRLVWAAEVCINVENVHERSHHVKLMPSIFRNARQIIVWLGSGAASDTGLAFASICKIVNAWRTRRGLADRIPEATFTDLSNPAGSSSTTQHRIPELKLADAWPPAIALFTHPWFRSIWSIPGVSTARTVVVMQGTATISWDCIGLAAAVLRENYARPHRASWNQSGRRPPVDAGILTAYFMYRLSVSQSQFAPLKATLHQLLSFSRGMTCRFSQDRIYALMGAPTVDAGEVSSRIVPDYGKPAAQVHLETALLIMGESRCLNLLADVQQDHDSRLLMPGGRYPKNLILSGPSWCPQWDSRPAAEVILPPWPCKEYHASEPSFTRFHISPDGMRLTSVGILVDEVSSETVLTEFHYWRGGDARPRAAESQLLREAGITAEDLRELALTLTCGKDWDGCPVSEVERHVADYARCLVREGLWWSIDWIGSIKRRRGLDAHQLSHGRSITVADLERISSGGHADRFLDCVASTGRGRAYFTTHRGHWGIGPDAMVQGDRLCSLHGAMVPFILRPRDDGTYHVVGECYVLEMMQGDLQRSIVRRPCSQVMDAEVRIEMV